MDCGIIIKTKQSETLNSTPSYRNQQQTEKGDQPWRKKTVLVL